MDKRVETPEEREARLTHEEHKIQAERDQLEQDKAELVKRTWRDNVYGRINVSVQTMNRVILIIGALLLAAIIIGIVFK